MRNLKRDPVLATLPAPVSLTQEQLAAVASETGALLGAGGGCLLVCGGIPGPFPEAVLQARLATTTVLPGGITGPSLLASPV